MASGTANKSKPYVPLAGLAGDGWSMDGKATAICYYGTVQLIIVTSLTFVWNYADCRKITTSIIRQQFHLLSDSFSTLMYRPGKRSASVSILRISTVDDSSLHKTRLRPRQKYWTKDRVCWFTGVQGAKENFKAQG
ncbi:hypothetical protein B0T18DRAFT_483033 [Schizothecium vesticola]|uniref:Uncharacterized protein n=1 Tax=Schizothecium vesticola TaxID=314040 RepID=A0AA40EGQ2_9PEZI|nr:hypothetical protein B0T18DRAFT_483033 [Schizothecium vesticola]